jgi:hypothetical protein
MRGKEKGKNKCGKSVWLSNCEKGTATKPKSTDWTGKA